MLPHTVISPRMFFGGRAKQDAGKPGRGTGWVRGFNMGVCGICGTAVILNLWGLVLTE